MYFYIWINATEHMTTPDYYFYSINFQRFTYSVHYRQSKNNGNRGVISK